MNKDEKVEYKCEVCGTSIDVSKTQYTFSGHRKGHCEQCEKIISLRDVVKRHWDDLGIGKAPMRKANMESGKSILLVMV